MITKNTLKEKETSDEFYKLVKTIKKANLGIEDRLNIMMALLEYINSNARNISKIYS